jgi:adenosylhomocysteine nucleosidase
MSTRRVVFLAAMPVELRPLIKQLSLQRTELAGRPAYRGSLGDVEVVGAVMGMGPEKAAATTEWVLDAGPADLVVNIGVAGGVAPHVKTRDLVMPEVVVDRATGEQYRPARLGAHTPSGTLLTISELEVDRTVHAELAGQGVVALDMETAALARVCEQRGIPWAVFRALSDHVDEELVDDAVFGMLNADGSTKPSAVVRYVVRHPWAIPRLARLGRDLSSATTTAVTAAVEAVRSAHQGGDAGA